MATIKALENSYFLVLDRKAFNKVIRKFESEQMNAELSYLTNRPFLEGIR
jgi:hypothetical protein